MVVEKKKKIDQAQIDLDAELARKLDEEEQVEIAKEQEAAALKKEQEALKKKKAAADRKKFVEFLKGVGYSGKQLGPMKLGNLVVLYEAELKKKKAIDERVRYEWERTIKAAYDVGAQIVKPVELMKVKKEVGEREIRTKAKQDTLKASLTTPTKRQKQIARKGPSMKKRKIAHSEAPTSTPTPVADPVTDPAEEDVQEKHKEDLSELILHGEKYVQADPIRSKLPNIIDWGYVETDTFNCYKITREDKSVQKFTGFHRIIKAVTREDLEQMHIIGVEKYTDKRGDCVGNDLVLEWLNDMFCPEVVIPRRMVYSPIHKWEHYENCGVYCVTRKDVSIEYYLVEKKYNHGLVNLKTMLAVKLSANSNSSEAIDLIWKIRCQIAEETEKAKKR